MAEDVDVRLQGPHALSQGLRACSLGQVRVEEETLFWQQHLHMRQHHHEPLQMKDLWKNQSDLYSFVWVLSKLPFATSLNCNPADDAAIKVYTFAGCCNTRVSEHAFANVAVVCLVGFLPVPLHQQYGSIQGKALQYDTLCVSSCMMRL